MPKPCSATELGVFPPPSKSYTESDHGVHLAFSLRTLGRRCRGSILATSVRQAAGASPAAPSLHRPARAALSPERQRGWAALARKRLYPEHFRRTWGPRAPRSHLVPLAPETAALNARFRARPAAASQAAGQVARETMRSSWILTEAGTHPPPLMLSSVYL